MERYRLSNAASADLDQLYLYGILNFGIDQANRYAQKLVECFANIANNPRAFREVSEIRPGYRRYVFKAHAIYFQIVDDKILVVRILGNQNIDDALLDFD